MGRNLECTEVKQDKRRVNTVRPKSEKILSEAPARRPQTSSTNLIKKNLDDYIFSLSNSEIKQKLESCPGKLEECPLLAGFRKGLKKSISNHLNLTPKNDSRLCKTSRNNYSSARNGYTPNSHRENMRMSDSQSNESSGKKGAFAKDGKPACSNPSKSMIRSTRAQDLRSQSNRDLLRPKTMTEKARTASPYLTALPLKKKKCSGAANSETKTMIRSNLWKSAEEKKKQIKMTNATEKSINLGKGKPKKEKPQTALENVALQRQKTQEIINPKIVKKASSNLSEVKVGAGDCEIPQLKKSQTFFICKGTKGGEGGRKTWEEQGTTCVEARADVLSDGHPSDEDVQSPKLKPLTHNDSFCLIAKSSQNWSQKNRSDDEKWLQYDLAYEEKSKKVTDKGILKNANHNLKSVDSLEKVESEKIVRFSDEMTRSKKVLKKVVRRKKRFQNFFTPVWYQKNKLFQKYLQILREKSILLSERADVADDLKPFRVPIKVKERYEAEMFGLLQPRRGKSFKNLTKDSYSY